jgi:hypothetical protein
MLVIHSCLFERETRVKGQMGLLTAFVHVSFSSRKKTLALRPKNVLGGPAKALLDSILPLPTHPYL